MAWLAVNKDGTELICKNKPKRWATIEKVSIWSDKKFLTPLDLYDYDRIIRDGKDLKEYMSYWTDITEYKDDVPINATEIELPKGTIYKLLGVNITWNDEPFEL